MCKVFTQCSDTTNVGRGECKVVVMVEWGLETSLQPRVQKMSWGTLFVDHPLRTSGGITVLLELTNLSRDSLHNLLHSLDKNQNVGKDGLKTVTN